MRIDLHPDDLFDREARGLLSSAERKRLEAHLSECGACQLERSLTESFVSERAVSPSDGSIAENIVERLVGSTRADNGPTTRWRWLVVAALVLLVTVALAAVGLSSGPTESPADPSTTSPRRPAPQSEPEPAEPESLPESLPTLSAEPSTDNAAITERDEPREVSPPSPLAPSAAQLFREANAARRGGRYAEAVRIYRELQHLHPGTRQEVLSRVSLGQLSLSRLGQPAASLPLFDSYLATQATGPLREEARVGRALSLRQLGRLNEEREAWETLLRDHPDTVHAARAQRRLEELR